MNVATNSQPGGWKSLPAELKGGRTGGARLERSTDAFKTPGMGDVQQVATSSFPFVAQQQPIQIGAGSGGYSYPAAAPGYVYAVNYITGEISQVPIGNRDYEGGSPTVTVSSLSRNRQVYNPYSGMSGLGMTAQEIAELIKTGASTTLPLIVAQTPGTIYTQLPDGTIQVYSQPTGTTANLPGIYGSALLQGGANIQPSGSVTLPGGATAQANFGNMGEMMPLLVIGGLFAFVLFAGRK